jgi:hypothetical protein
MKKKILYVIIACAVIALGYFLYDMSEFAKGAQEDAHKHKAEITVKTIEL